MALEIKKKLPKIINLQANSLSGIPIKHKRANDNIKREQTIFQ
jgi:hypothetical protein